MRYLIVTRGSPASGKSTWIRENGLEPYTICLDDIRLLCQSPELTAEGNMGISQRNDNYVWDLMFEILEKRMDRGDFIVIDATHSKRTDFTRYKTLCEKYRYRLRCVDFTDVPIEICKERNRSRDAYKFVPEDVIDRMYSRFDNFETQKYVKFIDKDNFFGEVKNICVNLNGYKKIHHIGDIHGCHTALMEYLDGEIRDDEFYIFTGDYIDRGIENAKVVKFLCEIAEKKNVVLLEGNHERWLWLWGNSPDNVPFSCQSREFTYRTLPKDLEPNGVTKKQVRMLCRKLLECFYYEYNGERFLCTHGGLSNIPQFLALISTEQMINGVGQYKSIGEVVKSFNENAPENHYQVFGHRNIAKLPVMNERCFIVDSEVEKGDNLRAFEISENGYDFVYTVNTVFRQYEEKVLPEGEMLEKLNANDNINKVFMCDGKIVSYNFDREVFRKKIWNEQTIKARGLFVNVQTGKIVMRAYEKFFNIDENESASFQKISVNAKYPIHKFVKYNGFLGLIGRDEELGMLYASKSTTEGIYADWFKHIATKSLNIDALEQYIKDFNVTFVFEVLDPENDPHIIEYERKEVILLDVVKNDFKLERLPYEQLVSLGKLIGAEVKEYDGEINDSNEFTKFVEESTAMEFKRNGEYIEGYVLEDAEGKMVKIKGAYYRRWKKARDVAHKLKKSRSVHENKLFTKEDNEFYGWLLRKKEKMPYICHKNIIEIRNMYETES
jgi:predicted kinase